MNPSAIHRAAVQARVPLIKFIGPRSALPQVAHEAHRHPAAPKDATYPLQAGTPSSPSKSVSSSASSSSLSKPAPGGARRTEIDFLNLPARYRAPALTEAEIEAVETGGASRIY